MFGIESTDKPAVVVATVLTYWAFVCRDRSNSPAMGLKTWEYLQSSIKNAAIPSRDFEDYLEYLSKKLVVKSLRPQKLDLITMPATKILRQNTITGEIMEFESDQINAIKGNGWMDLLEFYRPQGLREADVVKICKEKPLLVATHVRLRYEADKLAIPDLDKDIIDVV